MSIKAVIAAFQFLTIIPIRTKWELTEKDLVRSVVFFPLVGLLQGLIVALITVLGSKIFSFEVSAAFALLAYVLTTGGFHQDGLSDTFDALCVKSSGDSEKDREKRLTVMKGSTAGPIGVLAIVFSLLLKFLLIKDIVLHGDFPVAVLLLLLMPIFGKNAMVWTLSGAKSARKDGLGKLLLDGTGLGQSIPSTCLLFILTFGIFFLVSFLFPGQEFWTLQRFVYVFLSEAIIVWITAASLKTYFSKRFGGLTGDNLGAIHEVSEIIFLVAAFLWL